MIRTLTVMGGALLAGTAAMAQESVPIQPMDVNAARAELGKRMFYDPRLSGDTSLACASCHDPALAFTDGEALSAAYSGGAMHFRNAPPTLANVATVRPGCMTDAWAPT